jgi:hypothetical protein
MMARLFHSVTFAVIVMLLAPGWALAQDRLCDTQLEDCRSPILNLINTEPPSGGIDVAFWFIQDARYSSALVNAHKRGVPVRVLMDSRGMKAEDPHSDVMAQILAQLVAGGVPMREKVPDPSDASKILHFKTFLFYAQNTVEFSKGNFTEAEYVPYSPTNYSDESVFFTQDPRIVNSFKRRIDDLWTDATGFRNYANITAPLVRKCPLSDPACVIDPAMNFSPLQDFQVRAQGRIGLEPSGGQLDAIVFRMTDHLLPDAVIAAISRGVTARLIVDYSEYRNAARLGDAAHVDRLYMAGAQLKYANHGGIGHQATIILHNKGDVIFGSSNWTSPSANRQDEHNFFYKRGYFHTPVDALGNEWYFNWFADQFDRRFNDSVNYLPFVPKPPDAPVYSAPVNATTGVGSSVTLKWEGGPWAYFYDIYFGTSPTPPLLASNLQIGSPQPGQSESYTISNLQPGTTYYWKVVGKTYAQLTKSGPVWSFLTGGAPPNGSTPHNGAAAGVPGIIEAENYDDGGQGIAYSDTTPTNSGAAYRPSEGVDIQATTDAGGGYNVGWTKAGEWLKYTVNVATTGTYQLQTRVANIATGGSFRVEVDGVDQTGPITVPNTGAWQTFQTITSNGISLSAGTHVLRVFLLTATSTGDVANFNWFRLDLAGPPPPPPPSSTPHNGAPAAVPGIIEAENYDDGGQGVAYSDTTTTNTGGAYRPSEGVDIQATTDTGGGYNVGWTKAGEWLKYTVNVTADGTYQLQTRVAIIATGATFRVEVDGVDQTGPITVPNTGGWQTFQTVTTPGISLSAGTHVLRVVFLTASSAGDAGNYNWFGLQ